MMKTIKRMTASQVVAKQNDYRNEQLKKSVK
ncbi:UNVERIFIED_ORG: hypothetical protein QFZ59_004694 [Bacillus sp. B2I3]|nr:hypothetical protein [Bacillus sp. B2I3]